MFRSIASGLMIFICALPLSAQFTTASLGGEISDPSGSAVPEARVMVRNLETGFTQTVVSDAAGAFLFSRVPGRSDAVAAYQTGQGSVMGWSGCLLYTSPSPRDGLLSRMPSSA